MLIKTFQNNLLNLKQHKTGDPTKAESHVTSSLISNAQRREPQITLHNMYGRRLAQASTSVSSCAKAGQSPLLTTLKTIRSVSTRSLATATAPSSTPVTRPRFEKLDDGLTFDDFVSGEEIAPPETERVILGNTKQ